MSVTAYIGLGSNLENPRQQVLTAVEEIAGISNSMLEHASQLYQSDPVGPGEQEDYINAVVAIRTELTAIELLDQLQAIEQIHNRKRIIRWGARTLDLDILLYGDQIIDNERLIIPHKEMHWRNFVLCPLADIEPELTLPTGQSLQKLLQKCEDNGLSVIGKIEIPEMA
ncbi:2-amino-4-hydroxy-6-hydroxymethyldihydropteridine diphosphokinase [Sansalvadorimonas sp. 2012CJ34-2]|uniref:2-amino-4-hydroxy-6-hydroxymethyldihydropteridine pyrophosphokinase n=1 Tax=Parendozoicomonas callyspongiae TaxID=2942213 RepID=A0ABT0PK58_9GAMM|nr:2-amino-4-hydroxy-6-hydroxymethyldihydropteridine diphosphokinase [Sansalvadorimonas sp. 2012CJ34-2]MCL6271774.1 2-amino-4-hydroxy-6-hydroxymethyldihydropteridine diphosphokinase [Sansalvadorimonas sp. 2012CJ34-2]